MSSQKPLLCDWLIQQINSGLYPGLCWINTEKTQFRIPWKHGSRQDISAEDTKIFEAWAIASGRYQPGVDSADPSIWKRNFRNALNRKRQFHRMMDNKNDADDPHLIYEIRSVEPGASAEEDSEEASPDVEMPALETSPDVADTSPGLPPSSSPIPETLASTLNSMMIFDPPPEYGAHGSLMETFMPFSPPCYTPDYAESPHCLSQAHPALPGACEGAAYAMPPPVGDSNIEMPNVGAFQTQMSEFVPNGELVTEFEVKIFYRSKLVQEQVVTNHSGFRLCYNSAAACPYLQDLQFPDPSSTRIIDQQQIKYTNRLLDRMEQGMIVEVQDTRICARRLGSCKGFWSMMEYPTGSEPQQISSREFTTLCDLRQLVREIQDFLVSGGPSPLLSIWICCGELWPDPDHKPWTKKMIMVQVTPVAFKILHELALGVGASSLQSETVDLQLSDTLSSSSFLSILEPFMDVN
ncbi:interferon regulatory factor 3 [Mustelus asterias]